MSASSTISIALVRLPDDLDVVRELFTEYIDSLGVDLSFQDVEAELAELPGKYAPPRGRILLARDQAGRAVGCVALRPVAWSGISEDTATDASASAGASAGIGGVTATAVCEIKRLYVRPEARGHDLGRRLAEGIIASAREAGYTRILLDTLASMHAAQRLYASLGFETTTPYYASPVPGTVYLALDL